MKYCYSCGSPLREKKRTLAHDRYTGEFLGYWVKLVCPKWWRLHNSDYDFVKVVK